MQETCCAPAPRPIAWSAIAGRSGADTPLVPCEWVDPRVHRIGVLPRDSRAEDRQARKKRARWRRHEGRRFTIKSQEALERRSAVAGERWTAGRHPSTDASHAARAGGGMWCPCSSAWPPNARAFGQGERADRTLSLAQTATSRCRLRDGPRRWRLFFFSPSRRHGGCAEWVTEYISPEHLLIAQRRSQRRSSGLARQIVEAVKRCAARTASPTSAEDTYPGARASTAANLTEAAEEASSDRSSAARRARRVGSAVAPHQEATQVMDRGARVGKPRSSRAGPGIVNGDVPPRCRTGGDRAHSGALIEGAKYA